ncbi:MAG: pyruvate synthase subunit beta [Deltaproteobacteria bacterium]|nr:pyruvate synthase subunit beta [Deltaproteobacteria bacterium]
MGPGHLACQGCGAAMAMRYALKALGGNTIIAVPACCWSVIAGPFPYSNLEIPLFHCAFETAAATASGIRAALSVKGRDDVTVLAWAGDGGTFDIGFQALSGAAERGEDIIYCCYDNEAYMNTGIQRSSATPLGAWTTTSPEDFPKEVPKKDIDRIMAEHRIPYVATASIAYPFDLMEKFKKAKKIRGTKFLHILAPCPPGWRVASDVTVEIARLATDSRVFPIFEIFNGTRYVMNIEPKGIQVEEYVRRQGRFSHLTTDDIERIKGDVLWRWNRLVEDCGRSGP